MPSQFEFFSSHAEAAETDEQAVKVLLSLGNLFNSIQKLRNSIWRLNLTRFYKISSGSYPPIHDVILTPKDDEYYWPFLSDIENDRENIFDNTFYKAKNDSTFLKILRLLQRETNWDDLYRIFELIRKEHKATLEVNSNKSTRNKFTQTANHPEAAGDFARHSVPSGAAPNNPMTLDDAEAFIFCLLRKTYF